MSHKNNITKTFIIDDVGNYISACTSVHTNRVVSCSGNSKVYLTSGATEFNTDIQPTKDDKTDAGKRTKRFREFNSVSGRTTVMTSQVVNANTVNANTVDLGYDSTANEQRILDKNTSVLRNDKILGGNY